MRDAVGAIVSTDPFTEAAMKSDPSLRVIARVGVGTDSIDRAAADAARVAIAITPGMNAAAVADQTLAMILALTRKVTAQDRNVKEGRWERVGATTRSELPGKIVGLVGAGAIGREVARRLSGFDVDIVFYDPIVGALPGARRMPTLIELLSAADIVSLHVPLTPATANLIVTAAIARMKPGALLSTPRAAGSSTRPRCSTRCAKAAWAARRSTCSPPSRRTRTVLGERAEPRLLGAHGRPQPQFHPPHDDLGNRQRARRALRRAPCDGDQSRGVLTAIQA